MAQKLIIMKTIKITLLFLLCSLASFAQVGIGNTDPKASLDITSSNLASPANTDGILIPRIDNFPSTNPAADQDGMMVFVTGNGIPAKGFYYWDNGAAAWASVTGDDTDADFFEIGTTLPADNIFDDVYTYGKIKIGQNSPASSPLSIHDWDENNVSSLTISRSLNSGSATGQFNGAYITLDANTSDNYVGVNSVLSGTTQAESSNFYAQSFGTFNSFTNLFSGRFSSSGGNGRLYGASISFLSTITNTGNKYGFNVNIPSSLAGTHYGLYADVQQTTGYAGYFIGRTSFGNSSSNRYLMPPSDGTNGQVLATDGAGQINFINPSSIFTDNTNTLDQAYDQGVPMPNAGATIVADDGPVSITGGDGFNVRGDFGAAGSVVLAPPNDKSLLFFNPYNAVFRAGFNEGTDWTYANQGNYSIALGYSPLATGDRTFAAGSLTQAIGDRSTAMGNGTIATSFAETAFGNFNTDYTPDNTSAFDPDDRLLVVGNGTSDAARHNALTIYKNGLMNINDAYNMPTTDGTNGQILATDGAGQTNFVDPSAVFTDNDTQNTLDQAYNEGGAGAGRIIDANDGAVTINGTDGFLVTGNFGFGNTIDDEITGTGTRMFFNPRKAAFRAGHVLSNRWDNANVGAYSAAFGYNTQATASYSVAFGVNSTASGASSTAFGYSTLASGAYSVALGVNSEASGGGSIATGLNTTSSGVYSTAFGEDTTASGVTSTAFGYNTAASGENSSALGVSTIAPSYGETVIGLYNTNYTVSSDTRFNPNDRVFSVGNGQNSGARSNALTIYKNGTMNINDAYNMPLTDGSSGQVMTTDGAGNVTFQDATVNTDNQQIDNLALSGTTLGISLQNDGVAPVTVDLSSLQDTDDVDFYEFGTTNAPDDINDDKVTLGTLTIGGNSTPTATLNVLDNDGPYTAGIRSYRIFSNNTSIARRGMTSFLESGASNNDYLVGYFSQLAGSMNTFSFNYTAMNEGSVNNFSVHYNGDYSNTSGTGNLFGTNVNFFSGVTNTGNKYGHRAFIDSSIPGVHYGLISDVQKANSFSGVFIGRVSVGNDPSTNRYILPTADGSSGQVMTTDGSGNVTFQDAVTDTDNQQIDNFNFNSSTNILTLEVEDDGQPAQTVDLSSLNPTKSLARIVMAADQTFTVSGWQKINYNSVDFDTNGDFNTTTDTFVAPADGYYRINASWRSDGNSTSTGFFGIGIYINGLVVRGSSYNHTGNGQIIRYINNLIQLDAGDTVEIYINVLAPLTISLNDVAASFEIEQVQ